MTNENLLLKTLSETEQITQRRLAYRTGMSLGNVNSLLKRLIVKGLVKIERMNRKTVQYILTTKGITEKASLTYAYFNISCKYILSIENALVDIINDGNGRAILIYGQNDEIKVILKRRLAQLDYPVIEINAISDINDITDLESAIILAWAPEYVDMLNQLHIEYQDVLRLAESLYDKASISLQDAIAIDSSI